MQLTHRPHQPEGIEREERSLAQELLMLLPNFVRLARGLLTDRRVPARRKLLLAGLVAYLVSPIDVIPDFIPGLGQMDDLLVVVLVLHGLLSSVDEEVLLEHWQGRPDVILLIRRAAQVFARRLPVQLGR
ncbi:MAG: YkvA family protein [Gemmatimonadota bacterium]